MDYTLGVETAMDGAFILIILPYDKAATDWGYLNQNIAIQKYQYCSDEHIMLARENQKKIYGCERFDKYKNIILGNIDTIIGDENHKAMRVFGNILNSVNRGLSHYSVPQKFEVLLNSITYTQISSYQLYDFIYKDPNATYYSMTAVIDGLLPTLNGTTLPMTDYNINEAAGKDAAAVGGLSGIVEKLLDLQATSDGKFYENQTINFLKN